MSSTGNALLPRDVVRPRWHVRRPLAHYLLPCMVISLAVIPKLFYLRVGILGMDESILLIYPEQILDGRISNRDFFTVYGPGNFTLLAGFYSVLGQSLIVERLVGVAYQAFVVAGVATLARRQGQVASLAAGIVSALLLTGPNLLATSWMGGLAISVWALVLMQRDSRWALLAAGVLSGLATYWRFEMGLFVVAALPLIWGRRDRACRYLAGLMVGVVPTLVHMAVAGRETLSNVVLQRAGLNAQREWSTLLPAVAVFLVLLVAAVVVLIVVARRDRAAWSVAIFAVLLMPQAFQRIDYGHVVFTTGSVVLPLALAALLGRTSAREVPARLVAAGITLTIVVFAGQALSDPWGGVAVTHGGRTIYTDRNAAASARAIVDAVTEHVPPGSRVFVGSSDMSVPTVTWIALYQLLPEYRNDFYYLELPVGVAEKRGSPLVADIESADALILTQHDPDVRVLYPHFGTGAEDANRAVEAGFCPVEHVSPATIYLPC